MQDCILEIDTNKEIEENHKSVNDIFREMEESILRSFSMSRSKDTYDGTDHSSPSGVKQNDSTFRRYCRNTFDAYDINEIKRRITPTLLSRHKSADNLQENNSTYSNVYNPDVIGTFGYERNILGNVPRKSLVSNANTNQVLSTVVISPLVVSTCISEIIRDILLSSMSRDITLIPNDYMIFNKPNEYVNSELLEKHTDEIEKSCRQQVLFISTYYYIIIYVLSISKIYIYRLLV
jgi:hypothetical protein